MARYRTAVRTPRPAREVFDELAAFENVRHWDPGVVDARRITPGPVAVGTAFEVVASALGRRLPLEYRVVELERPRQIALEAQTSSLRSYDVITVEPEGDGAVVTYDARLELRGVLALADPVLRLAFRRIGDRAAAGLREALAGTHVSS